MTVQREWKNLLAPDEEILWQGAPAAKLRFEFQSPFQAIFAVFFVGFSIFWMQGAAKGGGNFWMFGLLFFGVGLFQLIGVHFWKSFRRRTTFYTLTNQNAFIATELFGKKSLKSYPIRPSTNLEYVPGQPGSVFFAEKRTSSRNGDNITKIGFEMIDAASKVSGLLREAQQRRSNEAENQDA
jgi:hypothetical protein